MSLFTNIYMEMLQIFNVLTCLFIFNVENNVKMNILAVFINMREYQYFFTDKHQIKLHKAESKTNYLKQVIFINVFDIFRN